MDVGMPSYTSAEHTCWVYGVYFYSHVVLLFWVSFPLFYFLFYFVPQTSLFRLFYIVLLSSLHPTFLYGQLLFAAYHVCVSLRLSLIPLSFLSISISSVQCDEFLALLVMISSILYRVYIKTLSKLLQLYSLELGILWTVNLEGSGRKQWIILRWV